MNNIEILKSKAHIIAETIEYELNSVVIKNVIKRSTGTICIMSFDCGEAITEKILPYDTFAQIIDGKAEIIIDGKSLNLETGEGIIIPANLTNIFKANERFKLVLTTIKPPRIRKPRL